MHNSLIPNLMVDNVCDTALFYQNILGFKLVVAVADFEAEMEEGNIITSLGQGQNLDWANLKLDPEDCASAEFMFQSRRSLEADVPALKDVAISSSQTLYLRTNDVDAQFDQLKDKVEVVQAPITRFYGMREWYLKDNNGYILCFGQELSAS
ncbi:MAG: VOC family protein [Cocleimonas sp.]